MWQEYGEIWAKEDKGTFLTNGKKRIKGENQITLRGLHPRNEHIIVRVVVHVSLPECWAFGSSEISQIDALQWTSVVFACPVSIPPSFSGSILNFLWKFTLCTMCRIIQSSMLFSQDLLLSYGWCIGPWPQTDQPPGWTFCEWSGFVWAELHLNNYYFEIYLIPAISIVRIAHLSCSTKPGYSGFSSVQNSIFFFYLFKLIQVSWN